MNFKIFKKIISLFVILTTTHVYADNLPDSLFGVKMFDSINNYEVTEKYEQKFRDGTRSRDWYVLKNVPNPNDAFSYYHALTNPNDDKIVSARGNIRYTEDKTSIGIIKSSPNVVLLCADRYLPKYVSALSNAWQIREVKFSDPEIRIYGKEIPENLKKGFSFNLIRELNFKKNNINMIARVQCNYQYFASGDTVEGGETTMIPFIRSDLWIKIMTEEYIKNWNKKSPPTKVYKNITVGNFIRKLSEGVSTEGF
jgi:hypothetical protein